MDELKTKKVFFVASEAQPFFASGGLGDVIGSLPKETAKKDVESIVVIPKYQDMKFVDQIEYVTNFDIYMGWRKRYCGIFKAEVDGVTFYFIDNEQYFGRPGLYGYDDDYERFAFFDFAVLELISHLNIKKGIVIMIIIKILKLYSQFIIFCSKEKLIQNYWKNTLR